MANNVIGVFDSASVADEVISDLTRSGFDSGVIHRYEGNSSDLESELQRSGLSSGEASEYAGSVHQDGALVVVQADDARTDEAVEIMNRYYTSSGDTTSEYASGYETQATGTANTGDARLDVVEEQLQIGKREVQRGGVRVRRVVSERDVEEQVTLRDETIRIDRHPVDRTVSGSSDLFTEQTIELTETDEEAVVAKEAHVVEEVVVGKDVQERTETVRDTVRRADVEIEQLGTAYGETLAGDERYAGREWHEVEGEARTNWERDNQGKGTWEEAQGSVKGAWDKLRGKR
ncbi:MAG: hypothetical protein AVDCRST_MAG86-2825 [uncultured Truepera sp.]|uniref:DUF2382 domain-containing protein n=1 Tax=uncultured Truepera sp. TaxID=543023 RepID=A0A6J4VMD7_9DEIN|nr:MAG: hypothetical protein AVDCRST_MAG86-2825 [uncultured Truepera sp.]